MVESRPADDSPGSADPDEKTAELISASDVLPSWSDAAPSSLPGLVVAGWPGSDAPTVVSGTSGVPSLSGDSWPVINLTDVRKLYNTGAAQVAALRGVSMSIDEGEYVSIVGPSGSGKSTLMHIIGCLDVPTGGTYLLAGEDVGKMNEVQLASVRNRRIGFVFQQFNLLASLSAQRNVEVPLAYAGVARSARRRRAAEALERVGLGNRLDHKPGELSGGQQQRVAVARALVTDPDLILADEPTGALDSRSAEDVITLFDELHGQGRTLVLITHDTEVAAVAERTIRLRDGAIDAMSEAVA